MQSSHLTSASVAFQVSQSGSGGMESEAREEQFSSTLPTFGYDRPASILSTHPRTITLSQVSEMSSLDSGVRTKPMPHSTLEKQLQLAQQDLHRLLEYTHVVVEENNALKNILQGAVITYDDDSVRDFCDSLIRSCHEIPVLRSIQNHLVNPEDHLGEASMTNCNGSACPLHANTVSRKTTHNGINNCSPTIDISVPTPGTMNHVTSGAEVVRGEKTESTLDAATSIRKLASLTFTESWREQQQEDTERELLKRAKKNRSEPRPIPSVSKYNTLPQSAPVRERDVDMRLSESLGSPKFYTKDLLPLIVERNTLKERVLRLEDELEAAKSLVPPTSTSPPALLQKGSRLNLRPVIGPKEHYITDVTVVGYKKQHGNYVYVIQTTWSDRHRYEIYRRYGEFFTFQDTLSQLFPMEAGKYKSSDRVLPTLPTIDNVLSILGRTNSESVLKSRLKTINDYCDTLLLRLDPSVSRAVYVVNFFKPYPGDKQLTRLEKPRGQSLTMTVYPQDIPAGCLFEEFLVIADHHATGENELSVKAGDIVRVIKKDEETGWWLVNPGRNEEAERKEEGALLMGYVPGSFLKKYEEGTLESTELEQNYLGFVSSAAFQEIDQSMKYIALADYSTDDPRQVCFKKGSLLIVVEKSEDGWWLVTHNGKEGWAPASYLEPAWKRASQHDRETDQELTESLGDQSYITKAEYTAQLEDEVSFPKHVMVDVIEKSTTGWWTIRYNGCVGVAPASLLTLTSHFKVSKKFKSSLTVDLGHSISGINHPPPRRSIYASRGTP